MDLAEKTSDRHTEGDAATSRRPPRVFTRRELPRAEELWRLPQFVANYAEDTLYHQRRHGDVFYRRYGSPSLFLCHPQLIRRIFRTNVRNYVKGPDYEFLRPLLGEGIFVSEGDLWTRQRRLLAPEFRLKSVGRFLPVINSELEQLFEEWACAGVIDVNDSMMRLTLRVLGGAMFQSDFEPLAEAAHGAFGVCLNQATKQMLSMGLLKPWLPTPGNLQARAAEAQLNRAVLRLIAERRHGIEQGRCHEGGVDMLSRMLLATDPETGEGMSEQQLLDEVKSLILAGHETTALTLSWALYLLTSRPAIVARVLDEARTVLGGRQAQAEDYPRLVYTRQVLLETMRLYPPVPGVTRRALEDDEFDGVWVRAGESVTIPIYSVHRHLEFWDRPERFDPERFAPERIDTIEPYSYLPFLRGRRACLGEHFAMLEAVIALAAIVARFELTRIDHGDIGTRPIATLRSIRPLLVRVRSRAAG